MRNIRHIAKGYECDGDFIELGPQKGTDGMVRLPVGKLSRHLVVAGATGTGKTRFIQLLMESCSAFGVPTVGADGKGDLSGMAAPAAETKLKRRAESLGQPWDPSSVPVEFLALGGMGPGIPVRVPVHEMDARLMARLLGLTPQQTAVMRQAYRTARTREIELVTLQDLIELIRLMPGLDETLASDAMAGRIVSQILNFSEENSGLFGGPSFRVEDLLRQDPDGWGYVSQINMTHLIDNPVVFSVFLLWLLRQLDKTLPEIGDTPMPKLVFFFDEAHALFKGAPADFVETVVSTVKRVRSKGIGVCFISQSTSDIPAPVLSQLSNRVQFALRANTYEELLTLKKTAKTFPFLRGADVNATVETLRTMAIGEGLVCLLDDSGVPTPPAVTEIWVPRSYPGALDDDEVERLVEESDLYLEYQDLIREWDAQQDSRRLRLEASLAPLTPDEDDEDAPYEEAVPAYVPPQEPLRGQHRPARGSSVPRVYPTPTRPVESYLAAFTRTPEYAAMPWASYPQVPGFEPPQPRGDLPPGTKGRPGKRGRPPYRRNPDGTYMRDKDGKKIPAWGSNAKG